MKQQHRLAGAIGIVIALAVLAGILTAVVFGNEDAPLPEQAAQTVQFTEREAGTADVQPVSIQQDCDGALTCFWLILAGLAAASLCLSIAQNTSHP